jgi:tape measure domain-containing protein
MPKGIKSDISFKADKSSVKKTVKETSNEIKQGFRAAKLDKALTGKINGGLALLKRRIIGVGAAFAAIQFTKASVSAAAEVEQIATSFEVLTGSARAAGLVLKDLQEFAAKTPFRLDEISKSSKALLSFGFSANEVKERLREIGNVSAGTGARLQEVAFVFGQVASEGRLTGERYRQFFERAIPITKALAEELGIAESQVKKFVEEGKVGFPVVQRAFTRLSETQFGGALEKQSQTLSGVFSTLSDNVFILQSEIGKIFTPEIVESVKSVTTFIQNLATALRNNKEEIRETGRSFSDLVKEATLGKETFKLLGQFTDAYGEALKRAANVTPLQRINKELKEQKQVLSDLDTQIILGGEVSDKVYSRELKLLDDLKKKRRELVIEKALQDDERDRLEAAAAAKRAKNAADEQERQRAAALKALGDFGKTQEQILIEQQEKQFDLARAAYDKGALDEIAYQERLNEIDRQFTEKRKNRRKKELTETQKLAAQTAKSIQQAIGSAIANGISKSIQLVVKNLVEGKNAFEGFGQFLLNTLGDLAIQVGGLLIALGTAILPLVTGSILTPSGAVAAIALGAGLVALGALLKAFSSKGDAGGDIPSGAIGGGGVFADSATDPLSNENLLNEPEREEAKQNVQVIVNGNVFDSEQTGLRIVDILNREFENNGSTIVNGNFR